jgi:hypothetical protein
MVKKQSQLPDSVKKDISGFEEIFEDYLDDQKLRERKHDRSKKHETYDLQTFLEEENDRLVSLELFLTKKLPSKINFSQTEQLIVEQLRRKNYITEKLLESFGESESLLTKNLSQLFNSHFS